MHGLDLEVREESIERVTCVCIRNQMPMQGVLYRGHILYHKQIIHAQRH